tara:strand:- start:315 stop:488 length:174 start_codon:yes stop_codon:yes gene_type:complete
MKNKIKIISINKIKLNNILYTKINNPKLYKNYIKLNINNLNYNYYSNKPKYIFNNIL